MENLEKINYKKFWANKTVLVTGHEGFLGSCLSKTLIDSGARVIGLDKVNNRPGSILNKDLRKNIVCIRGNVANLKLIKKLFDKYTPDIVFHLAAEAIVSRANNKPIRTFKSNIQGTWNILEGARNKKFIGAIIVASSDKAYGSHDDLPYREDSTPLKGSHPYDVSKSCADLICHTYHNTFNVPVCVTRCGNIYGPGDHNFSRLVPDAIRSALKNRSLSIRSDGKFTRDYIYVGDVVSGYLALAAKMNNKKVHGEAFNFSNEKPVSVLEIVKLIYKLSGKQPNYKILNLAKHEIKDQYLSAKKARRSLGWKPLYALEEGLKETIDYYKKRFLNK